MVKLIPVSNWNYWPASYGHIVNGAKTMIKNFFHWLTKNQKPDLQFPGSGWAGHDPRIHTHPEEYKLGTALLG